MPKPKQDPAMLLFGVAGILAAIVLSQIGILPSMAGSGIEGATAAGLLAGGGAGAGLIVWAILVQAYDIHRNSLVIDQVVEEVRLERLARGLDVEG